MSRRITGARLNQTLAFVFTCSWRNCCCTVWRAVSAAIDACARRWFADRCTSPRVWRPSCACAANCTRPHRARPDRWTVRYDRRSIHHPCLQSLRSVSLGTLLYTVVLAYLRAAFACHPVRPSMRQLLRCSHSHRQRRMSRCPPTGSPFATRCASTNRTVRTSSRVSAWWTSVGSATWDRCWTAIAAATRILCLVHRTRRWRPERAPGPRGFGRLYRRSWSTKSRNCVVCYRWFCLRALVFCHLDSVC